MKLISVSGMVICLIRSEVNMKEPFRTLRNNGCSSFRSWLSLWASPVTAKSIADASMSSLNSLSCSLIFSWNDAVWVPENL